MARTTYFPDVANSGARLDGVITGYHRETMVALLVLLTVVVALLALLVAGLLRSHAEILRRLHDLGAGLDPARPDSTVTTGVPAPVLSPRQGDLGAAVDIAGTSPQGEAIAVGIAGAEHRTMLAFLSSGCTTCRALWKALSLDAAGPGASPTGAQRALPVGTRVVVVTRDPTEESPAAVGNLAPAGTVVVMSSRAWSDYGVPGSPYFVCVDGPSASIVGEGTAATWEQLGELVAQAFAESEPPPPGPVRSRGAARSLTGPEREARADSELAKAGIFPGDPALHRTDIGQVFPGA